MYKPFYIVTQLGHEIARFKDLDDAKAHARKHNNTQVMHVPKDGKETKEEKFRRKRAVHTQRMRNG